MFRLKVSVRLTIGFSVELTFLALTSGIGVWRMSQSQGRRDKIVDENVYKMRELQKMAESVHIITSMSWACP